MERMSNAINARVEELREHLEISFREISYLETRLGRAKSDNEKLEEENKKLKEKIKRLEFDVDAWHQLKLLLEGEIEKLKEYNGELIENHKKDIAILCEENKKLKETIKDHQLYEEKLEHRIIELEELLHGE